jgi:hypothetical protein
MEENTKYSKFSILWEDRPLKGGGVLIFGTRIGHITPLPPLIIIGLQWMWHKIDIPSRHHPK